MEWSLGIPAIVLLIVGLVGQGFEMRKIRHTTYRDEAMGPPNIFLNKRNFKWYGMIGAGMLLWYFAERM